MDNHSLGTSMALDLMPNLIHTRHPHTSATQCFMIIIGTPMVNHTSTLHRSTMVLSTAIHLHTPVSILQNSKAMSSIPLNIDQAVPAHTIPVNHSPKAIERVLPVHLDQSLVLDLLMFYAV